jgi:hypothetical protein
LSGPFGTFNYSSYAQPAPAACLVVLPLVTLPSYSAIVFNLPTLPLALSSKLINYGSVCTNKIVQL